MVGFKLDFRLVLCGRGATVLAPTALLAAMVAWGCRPAALAECGPAHAGGRLEVQGSPGNALIGSARVELPRRAGVYLEYGNHDAGWLRTPASPAATSHRVPLLRLRPESSYRVRAFSVDETGCVAESASAEFTTGPLPAPLKQAYLETRGAPSFPLALMDYRVRASAGQSSAWLVALDQQSQPVWYYQVPEDIPDAHGARATITIRRRTNGNVLYMAGAFGFEEIAPDGRLIQRRGPSTPGLANVHHDFTLLPDGRILYLAWEIRTVDDRPNGGPANLKVVGDTLNVLDLDSGRDEQIWSAFDALDPRQRLTEYRGVKYSGAEDWSHANTVKLGRRGNVLLSMRHLNQVISLSPDLRTVEWKLGGPGSTFAFPDPSDQFYAQHDAAELPDGRLLLFDNGNFRPEGEYSRGLELELDMTAMTARKVWEYRVQSGDVFSDRFGSVERLPNGNTLLSFGWRSQVDEPIVLIEARPDGGAQWEQWLRWSGARTSRYRAYPIPSLAGETPVAAAGGGR